MYLRCYERAGEPIEQLLAQNSIYILSIIIILKKSNRFMLETNPREDGKSIFSMNPHLSVSVKIERNNFNRAQLLAFG